MLKYRELPKDSTESNETHKQCTGARGCDLVKLRSHFTNDSSKADGKRNRCKQCQRAYNKEFASNRRASDKKYKAKPERRFAAYKASAESRGYTWDLTRDQFMVHWQVPCTHCGAEIETIGLDRVDSNLPYQPDNIQPCCRVCNASKSDSDLDVWYTHMDAITLHRVKALGGSPAILSLLQETLNEATGEQHNETMYKMQQDKGKNSV